jgi:hypothetical protein
MSLNPTPGEVYLIQHCDKVCQWFSPDTSVSSTNKTDRHDITEILLKVALNNINKTIKSSGYLDNFHRQTNNMSNIFNHDSYFTNGIKMCCYSKHLNPSWWGALNTTLTDNVCQWLPPRYSWNIVKNGVKRHNSSNHVLHTSSGMFASFAALKP